MTTPRKKTSRPRDTSAYPWREWTDGRERLLLHGRDFHCEVHSFRGQVYNKAVWYNLRASTRLVPGGLLVQFHPGTGR